MGENNNKQDFTHFDDKGQAIMVDVGGKEVTRRQALAKGTISLSPEVLEKIIRTEVGKGDVLAVARLAGIMAAKKTSSLIPMCHPLFIEKVSIDFEIDREKSSIHAFCQVAMEGKTGVEMEALTGVSLALLTIYDMCKALDKRIVIKDIHLLQKTGGKSGDFNFYER